MSAKITEGQMDFLGLLNEYTDDQGATVRVHDAKAAPKPVKKPKSEEPKQLELIFEDLDEEFEEEERKKQAELEKRLAEEERLIAEAKKKAEEEKKALEAKKAEEARLAEEAKKAEEVKAAEPEVKEQPVVPKKSGNGGKAEQLFKQCTKCWCFDCKHNARNEGVPREMCGVSMPCPACKSCESEDAPTICEIGNAKEGCKFRAIEEGIFKEEDYEEL